MIKTPRIFILMTLCSALLSSCSVYQSEGRKNFENQVQRSPNITLRSVDLQSCFDIGTKELPSESISTIEINERQRMLYEHPALTILTDLNGNITQLCQYQVQRDPLNNLELLQLIEGINHEP